MTITATENTVPASRLATGKWCHEKNKQLGEGDIAGAYSADTIAIHGKIRTPFRMNGWLHATVSLSGTAYDITATAYRLADLRNFDGNPKSYLEASRGTRDENGFYHGMSVAHGGRTYVLVGPPVAIKQSDELEPVQASLF